MNACILTFILAFLVLILKSTHPNYSIPFKTKQKRGRRRATAAITTAVGAQDPAKQKRGRRRTSPTLPASLTGTQASFYGPLSFPFILRVNRQSKRIQPACPVPLDLSSIALVEHKSSHSAPVYIWRSSSKPGGGKF